MGSESYTITPIKCSYPHCSAPASSRCSYCRQAVCIRHFNVASGLCDKHQPGLRQSESLESRVRSLLLYAMIGGGVLALALKEGLL